MGFPMTLIMAFAGIGTAIFLWLLRWVILGIGMAVGVGIALNSWVIPAVGAVVVIVLLGLLSWATKPRRAPVR